MMVSVNVITQDEVMKNAVMFRENAEARYGIVLDWEQAFAAVPCASCNGLEILSKEGLCQDCDETGPAKKEVAAWWDCPVGPCGRCGEMLSVEDVEVTEECPYCIDDPF